MNYARNLLPIAVVLTLLAPLAAAETFTGTVRQGEKDTYVFDTRGEVCLQVITTHTITLTHEPVTDELMLVVPGEGAMRTVGGAATISFTTPTSCAFFTVNVIGVNVADTANYTLEVTSGGGGGEPI